MKETAYPTVDRSTRLECGPVQPAQAIGGKFMGLLKKLMRAAVLFPRRSLEWVKSFTLITSCTVLFLSAMQMIAMLSFLDVKSVCLSTSGIIHKLQGVSTRVCLNVTLSLQYIDYSPTAIFILPCLTCCLMSYS